MQELLNIVIEHADTLIGAAVGVLATGIVFLVKKTPTKLDDKALELLAEKVSEKLK